MNIFDLVNPKEIATYWSTVGSNKVPYLGATLFPSQKQLGIDLSWFKGSDGLPVELSPAAFDTETTIRNRIGVDKIETEMPFFKDGFLIKERDRIEINKAIGSANAAYIMPIIQRIYADGANLVNSADVTAERMRMQLLSTGLIGISANRQDYNYDYKFKISHKETLLTTAKWSDYTNSDPIEDIKRWQDVVEDDTGVRPTGGICTRKTWNYLLHNQKIKLDMNVTSGQNIILTDAMLKTYLFDKLAINVAVYNKKFLTRAGVATLFFPDETFTLIPDGNLGNTYYGTTPEESDLMAGNNANVQIVNTGVAITTVKKSDPVNVLTKASMVALPSFEAIDSVFIGTVA